MYLYKSQQGVYYVRVCTPKLLKDLGFPFDHKISLRTKDRRTAKIIGLRLVSAIHNAFHSASFESYEEFRPLLNTIVRESLSQKNISSTSPITRKQKTSSSSSIMVNTWPLALDQFLDYKNSQNLTPLTLHQLNQRITYFFESSYTPALQKITSRTLMDYVAKLNQSELSPKSCKDYYAALTQFLRWCSSIGLLLKNPAADIKARFKKNKKASVQRERWTPKQLSQLYSSTVFNEIDQRFQWVTLILTFLGLRPNEACQLRVKDIVDHGGIPYINITDHGSQQRVKNQHSVRMIPIHNHLIDVGFLAYVDSRRIKRLNYLFDYKPDGINEDWSHQYCKLFGKVLSKIGFKPGQRPTAYSLRHTFIDVLKQQGVAESTVADLVGHNHASMTFGRYGKQTNLKRLLDAVNQFSIVEEQTHEQV